MNQVSAADARGGERKHTLDCSAYKVDSRITGEGEFDKGGKHNRNAVTDRAHRPERLPMSTAGGRAQRCHYMTRVM